MSNDYLRAGGVAEPPAETERDQPSPVRAGEQDAASETTGDAAQTEIPPGPPRSVVREYFESLVVTAVMALFGMTFVVQAVKVPTGSMLNTILIGDHLLVNKFIFAPGPTLPFLPQREVRRGDIIVFKYPGNKFSEQADARRDIKAFEINYVKRVIGLPGERLQLRGGRVFVNGEPLPERNVVAAEVSEKAPLQIVREPPRQSDEQYTVYQQRAGGSEDESADYPVFREAGDGREIVIPADHYFVMGDNRDNSEDSRYWGFVPRSLIIGRAMFVYWSYDESAPSQGNPLNNFLFNSRWDRTGTLVK